MIDSRISVNTHKDKVCYSDYKWSAGGSGNDCTTFLDLTSKPPKPDIEKCLYFGHIVSASNINASEACCECQYGYNNSGGGYRGDLIGKYFRAGFIDNTNVPIMYNYSSHESISKSGLIYDFIIEFFNSIGLGMIEESFVEFNGDSYRSCVRGKLYHNFGVMVTNFASTMTLIILCCLDFEC